MSTKSIYIDDLHNAIEAFAARHPEAARIGLMPTHIAADGLAYGYAETDDPAAIAEIEEYAGVRDAATLPFAPAHQCPVEEDGQILFA